MRRLVQHTAVGVGFTAVVVSVAVAGLGSPAAQTAAVAVPVTVVSASVNPGTPTAEDIEAERVAREAEQSRIQARAKLVAAATQAAQRAAALEEQSRSISEQRTKVKAAAKAKAAAAKKEAAAAKARADAAQAAADAAIAARGYEDGVTEPREMARQILKNKFGYGDDQYSCFNNIIIRESNWNVSATNPSSGAYGIPQALPGSKMASVAEDWRTNPATQITWAVQYMNSRYGSPCEAWSFKDSHGWY
ncbi:transglycosylase SLT domain-containing protein [uncultured Friedmanniella sp.]|uniref:aggregation-promoting factor C-terminal-like domain-containing protein n=1 Tax=uncultured Friedmanniella sp. TaxID=335381 RepID=UPI0035CC6972